MDSVPIRQKASESMSTAQTVDIQNQSDDEEISAAQEHL